MNENTPKLNTSKRIFTLPKNIFLLGLVSLFNDFSSEMIYSVFPAFFTSVLHAGAESLGIVDGIAESLSNFFKIYSGNSSDRLQNRKSFVVWGYAIAVLSRPFYVFASTVSAALGLRVVDRIGKGLRDAPRDAIISLSTPKEELGRSFGFHRAMDTLGSILGPLVAYLILRQFPLNFNLVFLSSFVIGLFAILSLVFISDVMVNNFQKKENIFSAFKSLSWRFKLFILSIFVLSIGTLPVSIILLKTTSIGLVIADIPLFYMIYNISYASFSMLAGKMSDKIGSRVIIFSGYVILLLSYVALNYSSTQTALALSFFIFGLFPALTDGVQRSFASQLSNTELRGSAMGLLNASIGFGVLIAGILGGYIWQSYNPHIAFLAFGMIIFIGLILFLFTSIKNEAKNTALNKH